jgi:hypothetical protein
MTFADRLIPYYWWFKSGFAETSLPLSMVNLALLIITMLTVRGINIPLLMLPVIAGAVILFCIGVGWFFETYGITGRLNSRITTKQNPEIYEMCQNVKKIIEKLEEQ